MEGPARRRAMVGGRTSRSPDHHRGNDSLQPRQTGAETAEIDAILQAISRANGGGRIAADSKEDAMIRGKEEMLSELREVRKSTLEFIGKTMERDLSKYRMPHPFLGTLNSYAWLQLIASHEVRHTEQMKEIGGALPKVVAILQK